MLGYKFFRVWEQASSLEQAMTDREFPTKMMKPGGSVCF